MVLVLATISFVAATAASGAQGQSQQPDSFAADSQPAHILLDARMLPDLHLSKIISVLGTRLDTSNWWSVTIAQDFTIGRFVDSLYNTNSHWPKTREAILELVQFANDPVDPKTLQVGSKLWFPVLPSRPTKLASVKFAQIIGWSSDTVVVSQLDSAILADIPNPEPEEPASAGTWVIRGYKGELIELRALLDTLSIGSAGQQTAYLSEIIPAMELAHDPPTRRETTSSVKFEPSAAAKNIVAGLNPKKGGSYRLLDFFDRPYKANCSHGNMVLDVAQATLRAFDAPAGFSDKLIRTEMDFYKDRNENVKQIALYVKSFRKEQGNTLNAAIKVLQDMPAPKTNSLIVPSIFLQAIYWSISRDTTVSVASSSFYTIFDGFKIVPDEYDHLTSLSLLAAVLDDSGTTIEATQRREPIKSFWKMSDKFGVVLVGAQDAAGVPFGMTSNSGRGVSTVGPGTGWRGKCIDSADVGTSYSTPAIGVMLLLARSYWEGQEMKVNALEARRRLEISSDVVPRLVNVYSSGGVPQLERLLRKDGKFGIRLDGAVEDMDSAEVEVDTRMVGGAAVTPRSWRRGSDGFAALQFVGGQSFVYLEHTSRWVEVDIVRFKMTVGGREVPLRDFYGKYRGIGIL